MRSAGETIRRRSSGNELRHTLIHSRRRIGANLRRHIEVAWGESNEDTVGWP
jgi:hypothetical protein